MRKIILILIPIVVVIIIIISNREKTSNYDIVIGAPLSLTGGAAVDGQNIKRGIDLAVADLAQKGLKIRVVYEDDNTDPKRTVSAIDKMMSLDKPDALIGPTWSFLAEAASPNINKYKILAYEPADTSEFVGQLNPYVFFGAVKNSEKYIPTLNWLKSVNAHKVAVIVDKGAWGASHIEMFKKAIADAGAELTLIEEVPFGSESATIPMLISKIKALGSDSVLTTGYEDGLVMIIKKAQDLKIHIPVLMATGIPEKLLADNVIGVKAEDQFYYMKTRISDEFSNKFRKVYGVAPGSYADSAYDGVMMIAEAVKNKAKDETLAEYFRNKINYTGYQTTYAFDSKGDIKGGDWVVERLK